MSAFWDAIAEMAKLVPDQPIGTEAEETEGSAAKKARPFHLAHAFTPNEQARYGGSDHIVTATGATLGRISREPGDALCKPRRKFWGLGQDSDKPISEVSCKRCREIAEREAILPRCADAGGDA